MYKNLLFPASILAGTIIGAGIFSLPFIFKEVGLSTSFFYLAIFSLVYLFIYFLYADLIIRTPGEHRFVGLAKIYLGINGFWAALFIGLIQLFFVLTIYLVLAPSFSLLFINNGYFYHFLVFWLIGSIAILFNTKRVALLEFLIVGGIIAIIALIFGFGFNEFLSKGIYWGNIDISKFLVVGPILFSLSGAIAIPEIISYFRETNTPISFLKKSLFLGAMAPVFIYAGFVIGILGLSKLVTEDAVTGLVAGLPIWLLALVGILGFLSLISSYIVIGLNARRILEYDLSLSSLVSRLLVIFAPVGLYLAGFQSFIGLVGFVGSIFLPLESIFIIFMWLKANKKLEMPPILPGRIVKNSAPFLLLVFIMTLIYAIIK
ncbi:MAG: aromatic amino acid transport family protein [bacterium]|nr:aromatic amino acid transport family protein [bacterium]